MPIWEEFRVSSLAYAITVGVASLVIVPVYLLVRSRRLLPMQRVRPVHWRGIAVWIRFFLYFFVQQITLGALEELGFYEAVLDAPASSMRKSIWAAPLFGSLWLAILYWVMFAAYGVRPADFGMSHSRGLRYAVMGYAGFLVMTPLIHSLHAVTQWSFNELFDARRDTHPIELLSNEPLDLIEWVLLFFLATVAAPVMEEVLCRGILQGWLQRASLAGHVWVAVLNIVIAAFFSSLAASAASPEKDPDPEPIIFATAMSLGYGYLIYRNQQRRMNGVVLPVVGSAMVWSAMHSHVWPSPIALLPLGIALGYLAYRTQSLIPGIVLHGLFNTVACIGMLFKWFEMN